MQQGGVKNPLSTPNSILRKRANKENQNETKSARKLRLRANRRVSFAPDEELETMHLYQKDKEKQMSPQVTEDITAGLSQAMPWNMSGLQPDLLGAPVPESPVVAAPPPAAVMASPGFSPLSMDLTNNSNNSFEFRQESGALSDGLFQPGMLEYTRNITVNVPGLSTLVEEDEECGMETGSSGDGLQPTHTNVSGAISMAAMGDLAEAMEGAAEGLHEENITASPCASPFVLREMQLDQAPSGEAGEQLILRPDPACSDIASPNDTDGLKGKWGFTPGREDTLDVSHGRNLMGDTTYNHVYGNATTGELTAAMKNGLLAGPSLVSCNLAILGQGPPAGAPPLPPTAAVPTQRDQMASPAPVGNTWGQASPQWPRGRPSIGAATDMTIGLLEDDNPTDVWRQPFPGGAAAGGGGGAGVGAAGFGSGVASAANDNTSVGRVMGGETTNLLAGNTTALNLDAHMVGAAGAAVNGATATVNGFTAQLLADRTAGVTGTTLEGYIQRLSQQQASQEGPKGGAVDDAGSQGLLEGQDLTLDDFVQPPEPPETSLAQCTPCAQHPAASRARHPARSSQQQYEDACTIAAEQYGLSPLPPRSAHTQHTSDSMLVPPLSESKPFLGGGGGFDTGRTPMEHRNPSSALAPRSSQLLHALSSAQKPPLGAVPASGGFRAAESPSPMLPRNGAAFGSQSPAFSRFARPAVATGCGGGGLGPAGGHQSQGSVSGSQPMGGFQGALALLSQPHLQSTAGQHSQQMAEMGHPLSSVTDVPSITFQEFLQAVEVRFLDDMRRRTSFLPPMDLHIPSDTPPETLGEALDALHASGAHASLSNALVQELAEVVEGMHMRNAEVEGELARNNPTVFTAVQIAGPADLERIRDQMKLLKRLCRHRTAMAWKQRRIAFEQALSAEYSTSLAALNSEAEYMRARLSDTLELEKQLCKLDTEMESHRGKLAAAEHDAAQRKDLRALQRQRLAELRASNELRQQRHTEAAARQQALRSEYETALGGSQQSQRRLMQLRGEGIEQCTPSKEAVEGAAAAAAAEREEATRKLVQRQEKLDIILGLMGAQMDTRSMGPSDTTWSLSIRGQFRISVRMPPAGAPTQEAGPSQTDSEPLCMMWVKLLEDGFKGNELSRLLMPHFESLFANCTSFPRNQLPQVMDEMQVRLGRASMLLLQLRSLPLSWPLLSAVTMNEAHSLKLGYIHIDSCTKLEVEIPVDGLLHMASTKPAITARIVQPTKDAVERSQGIQAVLNEIQPSPLYLQQLCYISSQVLSGCAEPKAGPSATAGMKGARTPMKDHAVALVAARSPLKLYGNPLFLTPRGVN